MPSRNILKIDTDTTYYHIYARGTNKQAIFTDDKDYAVFLNLLKRYLSPQPIRDAFGRGYPHLYASLDLLAYCLMPNHFHLLIYQIESGSMQTLMRGVMTSYSRYFNHKYKRTGPLFESRYKASTIDTEGYLHHISRYIHLNPKDWQRYKYSSINAYLKGHNQPWLKTSKILGLFNDDMTKYAVFIQDYEDHKSMLDEIKHELADK